MTWWVLGGWVGGGGGCYAFDSGQWLTVSCCCAMHELTKKQSGALIIHHLSVLGTVCTFVFHMTRK